MGDVVQYIPPSAQRRMAAAMRADDFEPLPAFVVQPWKTLDNN